MPKSIHNKENMYVKKSRKFIKIFYSKCILERIAIPPKYTTHSLHQNNVCYALVTLENLQHTISVYQYEG